MKFNLKDYALWTALVTPFTENMEIDFPAVERMIRQQEEANNGVVLLGSTGEALNLSLAQKKDLLYFVIKMRPEIPLMVGVGGHQIEDCVAWVQFVNQLQVHGFLFVTPHYAKPGQYGQFHWFHSLLDQAKHPVMLYNVPGRSAIKLHHDAWIDLARHPRVWALKEASGSCEEFDQYQKEAPHIAMYSGDDAMMPDFTPLGVKGLVSVASNVWPQETALYVKKCLRQELSQDEIDLWKKCTNSLFCASNPVPVKFLLHHNSIIHTPYLLAPLSHEDMLDQDEFVIDCHQMIQDWMQKQ